MSDVMIIKNHENDHFTLINDCFKSYLSDIGQDSSNHLIMRCINQFKRALLDKDIISYEIEDEEITHSDKIKFDFNLYFKYPDDLAKFVSSLFGTAHAFVRNQETYDGIIFFGQQNNIYATILVFEFLEKITSNIYSTYFQKLKRYKKQETKEDKARDHMDDWLEDLKSHVYETRFFDISNETLFGAYAKKHFKTTEDNRIALYNMCELMKPVLDAIKGKSTTYGEFGDKIYALYPEDKVIEVMTAVDDLKDQDLILTFNKNRYFDKDEFDWDE